jgi:hypothetical protein
MVFIGFICLASTPISAIQAMVKPGQCLTIQSHPEFVLGVVRELIDSRRKKGIFGAEQCEQWLSVLDNPTDGDWFAVKMIKFVIDK